VVTRRFPLGQREQNAESVVERRRGDFVFRTKPADHGGVERREVIGARNHGNGYALAQDRVHALKYFRLRPVHGRLVVIASVAHQPVDFVEE